MDPKPPSSDHHWGLSWWVPQGNNKRQFLTRHKSDHPQAHGCYSPSSAPRDRRQSTHPQVSSWEWFNFIVVSCCLRVWLLVSLIWSTIHFPSEHWLTALHAACPLGAIKEVRQQLRQPQRLRDNQKFGFGLFIYMTSVHQTGRGGYLIQWAETNAGDLGKRRTRDRSQIKGAFSSEADLSEAKWMVH